jgi:hypothetical protein
MLLSTLLPLENNTPSGKLFIGVRGLRFPPTYWPRSLLYSLWMQATVFTNKTFFNWPVSSLFLFRDNDLSLY